MAKAVTLKNSNNEEVYPVTDASLVNGSIYTDTPGTVVPATPDVTTARIKDEAVTSDKIDWTTIAQHGTFAVMTFSASSWTQTLVGGVITVSGLVANATYKVSLNCSFTELMNGEARLVCTGASTRVLKTYTKTTAGLYGFAIIGSAVADSSGVITLQRAYSGEAVTNGRYGDCEWFIERIA